MPITLNGDTGLSGVAGTASTPALVGTDTDTGVWFPAANTVAMSTGGTERIRIDTSGNLFVGGTTQNTANKPVYSQTTAKAWVNFNLSTSTVRQSFNVSSITNLGTANAQVNFTTALSDADFSAVASCNQSTAIPNVTAFNASYVQVYFPYYNGAFVNPTIACVAVFR